MAGTLPASRGKMVSSSAERFKNRQTGPMQRLLR